MTKTKKSNGKGAASSKRQKNTVPTLTEAEERIVRISFEKENDGEQFDALLAEYMRFMHLKIRDNDTNFAPSDRIDEIWHAHILSTKVGSCIIIFVWSISYTNDALHRSLLAGVLCLLRALQQRRVFAP